MTKPDILAYLIIFEKLRKRSKRSWIGSYNISQLIFYTFFKWFYNQDEPEHKKRLVPDCIKE